MTSALGRLRLESRPCPSCGSTDDSAVVHRARLDPRRFGDFTFSSRKTPDRMHHRLVKCPGCRLVYANPAPTSESLRDAYHEAAYDSGEEARFAGDTYARLLHQVIPELPATGGALDIGAGDGAFLRHLVAAGIDDVVGIEPSEAPVAAAAADVRGRIVTGMFDADDFEPARFRIVTAFQTLEHVADPLGLCRGANRLLGPGGALLVVCHDQRAATNRVLGRLSPIYDVEHLQLFCPQTLRRLLEDAGFRRLRFSTISNRYPLRYWARLLPVPPAVKRPALTLLERSGVGSVAVALPAGNFAAIAFKE